MEHNKWTNECIYQHHTFSFLLSNILRKYCDRSNILIFHISWLIVLAEIIEAFEGVAKRIIWHSSSPVIGARLSAWFPRLIDHLKVSRPESLLFMKKNHPNIYFNRIYKYVYLYIYNLIVGIYNKGVHSFFVKCTKSSTISND